MPGLGSSRKALRAKEEQRQKRLRGHHIKRGLGELGDLDAAKSVSAKKARTEAGSETAPPQTSVNSPPEISTVHQHDGGGEPASSSTVARTVFGVDWEEWKDAKRVLFSADASPEEKRDALSRLRLWQARARRGRPVPPYVDSTIVLMDALLCDEAADTPEVRLTQLYGAAISRVVHIMTGSLVSGKADTYRKRARQLQFPEEAVEVRQRVAHGALPALSELRWVCGLTLQFLFHHYWLVQEQHVRDLSSQDSVVERAPRARQVQNHAQAATGVSPRMNIDDIYDLLKEIGEEGLDADGHDATTTSRGARATDGRPNSRYPPAARVAGWRIL